MTVRRPLYLQALTGWSADDDRRHLDAFYPAAGVVRGGLSVGPNAPVAMNVVVQPGYVVVPAKTATNGKYLGQVTVAEVVTIGPNSSGNPRIDIIVAQVLDTVAGGDGSDVLQIVAVQGTPAGSPTPPATPANATLLANVAVANGAANIVAGNITDKRVLAPPAGLTPLGYGNPLAGSLPTLMTNVYWQAGTGTVTTDGAAKFGLTFPVAFSNGVLYASVEGIDTGSTIGQLIEIGLPTVTGYAAGTLQARTPNGTAITNTLIRYQFLAIGW